MKHPCYHDRYGIDITIARWWDNELTIDMTKGQHFYIKTDWDSSTYNAWIKDKT
ncbi:hypothetical protein [Candidatus Azobacteroides pseudotrichonymphae]|uniref:hypothetical protein n=1 Tax=Candidatus Azobacteroides pseudotrichonymphae TaxID=511435 RepID=UPI00223C68FA|nr:hypothetical protein [Candidatus Azobacteroides pseudotrichonymphae]